MKFDLEIYYYTKTDDGYESWVLKIETIQPENKGIVTQFKNIMNELKIETKRLKKLINFHSFWKIVLVLNENRLYAIKSFEQLENKERMYFEYLLDFNWKKMSHNEICKILVINFGKFLNYLNSESKKKIILNSEQVEKHNINLINLKEFVVIQNKLNIKEDSLTIKKISYRTPIKFRN